MTTHILSMTYQPKIEGVRNGTIRQTIRKYNEKRPFKVGDKLLIHGWEGRPYCSPWSWRMEVKLVTVADILVDNVGMRDFGRAVIWREHWDYPLIDELAELDGISPPTGQALKKILERFHGKFTDAPVRF